MEKAVLDKDQLIPLDSPWFRGEADASREPAMHYHLTIRYGIKSQRYHTFSVEAADVPMALRATADQIPADITGEVDLVELRIAPDFEKNLLGQGSPEG
jgi:hypothetical protein